MQPVSVLSKFELNLNNKSKKFLFQIANQIVQTQKTQLYDAQQKAVESIFKDLNSIMSSYLAEGQYNTIASSAITIDYKKSNVSAMASTMQLTEGSVQPSTSFCSMYTDSTGLTNCSSQTIVTAIVSYLVPSSLFHFLELNVLSCLC